MLSGRELKGGLGLTTKLVVEPGAEMCLVGGRGCVTVQAGQALLNAVHCMHAGVQKHIAPQWVHVGDAQWAAVGSDGAGMCDH